MATGFLLVGVGLSAMVGSRPAAMVGHGPSASATRMPPTPTALARMRGVLPSVQQAALLGSTTPARLLLHDFFMAHDDADGAAGGGVSGGLYGGEKSGPTFPLTGPSTLAAGPPAPLLASTLACSSTPHRFVEGGRLGANFVMAHDDADGAAGGGVSGGLYGGEKSGPTFPLTGPSTLAAGPPAPLLASTLACSSTPHRFVEGGRLGANLGTHDAQARQAAAGGGTGGQSGGPLGGETSLAAGGGETSGATSTLTTAPSTLAAGPPIATVCDVRSGGSLAGGQPGGPLGGETSLAAGGGETSGATSTFTTAPSTLAAGPPIPTVCDVSIGGNVVRVGSDSTGDY